MYYKLKIEETEQHKETNKEGEENFKISLFNKIEENFKTLNDVISFLKHRYYKIKLSNINKTENSIFIDDLKGESEKIGFIVNYWNSDISHNSKKWMQKDWITIAKIEENYLNKAEFLFLIDSLKK